MTAFAPSTAITASTKHAVGNTSFTSALPKRDASVSTAPTMVLLTTLRKPLGTGSYVSYGGYSEIMKAADNYMARSVRTQYLAMSNASGVFGLQCTEGSVKGAAEVSRVRALSAQFRARQASPSKQMFDMYENRKNAIINSHGCHYEEQLFKTLPKTCATYNIAQAEANGSCVRYAAPETIEEAAMFRYMDIQTKIAANPTGVYNTACNEGSVKDQAEDVRVAALNTAYRQGQKSLGKLLDEKYQQKKSGYVAAHECTYESGLVSQYPALGACFRSKSYGY